MVFVLSFRFFWVVLWRIRSEDAGLPLWPRTEVGRTKKFFGRFKSFRLQVGHPIRRTLARARDISSFL